MMKAQYTDRGWKVSNEAGDHWWVTFAPRAQGVPPEVYIFNKHGKDMDPRNQHGQAVLAAVKSALESRRAAG